MEQILCGILDSDYWICRMPASWTVDCVRTGGDPVPACQEHVDELSARWEREGHIVEPISQEILNAGTAPV